MRHLTEAEDTKNSAFIRKKKKAKIQELGNIVKGNDVLSVKHWHLKALVLSSLHKCFLYDTGNLKFLDSSSFQASLIFSFLNFNIFSTSQLILLVHY